MSVPPFGVELQLDPAHFLAPHDHSARAVRAEDCARVAAGSHPTRPSTGIVRSGAAASASLLTQHAGALERPAVKPQPTPFDDSEIAAANPFGCPEVVGDRPGDRVHAVRERRRIDDAEADRAVRVVQIRERASRCPRGSCCRSGCRRHAVDEHGHRRTIVRDDLGHRRQRPSEVHVGRTRRGPALPRGVDRAERPRRLRVVAGERPRADEDHAMPSRSMRVRPRACRTVALAGQHVRQDHEAPTAAIVPRVGRETPRRRPGARRR